MDLDSEKLNDSHNASNISLLKILVLIVFTLLVAALASFATYWYINSHHPQLSINTISPSSLPVTQSTKQKEFVRDVEVLLRFKNRKGEIKKWVRINKWGDPNAYLYLTDDYLSLDSAVKVSDISQRKVTIHQDYRIYDENKDYFVFEYSLADGSWFSMISDEGKVLFDRIPDSTQQAKMFDGIQQSYPLSFLRFSDFLEQKRGFRLTAEDGNNSYTFDIDGNTGNYIERSRKKVK